MSTRSIDSFEGRELFDSNGYKIGDIESVVSEDGQAFALVKSGLFGTIRRLVPLSDVSESDDQLVVPYSKDKVKAGSARRTPTSHCPRLTRERP